jgi:purine-binding chemotaxis protein CheW
VYGIEIRYVTEIIGIQPITIVPEVPEYVKGIINLRGKIIPVIDVRLKFRKEAMDYNDRTCIVVVDIQAIAVGLIVDQVAEVITIPDENIVPPPDAKTGFQNRYIKGVGKVGTEVKLLLECERLLTDEETEALEAVS